jgi:hypothetical protein
MKTFSSARVNTGLATGWATNVRFPVATESSPSPDVETGADVHLPSVHWMPGIRGLEREVNHSASI